jgi:hypothetical protein
MRMICGGGGSSGEEEQRAKMGGWLMQVVLLDKQLQTQQRAATAASETPVQPCSLRNTACLFPALLGAAATTSTAADATNAHPS